MRDVVVLKAAQDVGDGVDLADMAKELVAQALALGGAFDEARDVDDVSRVGTICADLAIAASLSSRSSGTPTSPTLGSMVQNG